MEFIDVMRYFGALLLVLALVGGAGLIARRFGVPGITRASADKRLAVVETLMVGPRQRLFIVRVTRPNAVASSLTLATDGADLVVEAIGPGNLDGRLFVLVAALV